jgi:NADH-quinone oxidoreductase subunit A
MIYFFQYFILLIFFCFSLFLSVFLIFLSYILTSKANDWEKTSSYECGFEPFSDSRNAFNIQFYIIGILFIIFDIEISYLLPWAISLGNLGVFGFWVMIFFLIILTIGFIYEWKKGALNWF